MCQRELEDTSHDVFEQNDMDNFCDLLKTMMSAGCYGHKLCSALRLLSHWRTSQSLKEKKEVASDGEAKEVDIKVERVFKVGRGPLFFAEFLAVINRNRGARC